MARRIRGRQRIVYNSRRASQSHMTTSFVHLSLSMSEQAHAHEVARALEQTLQTKSKRVKVWTISSRLCDIPADHITVAISVPNRKRQTVYYFTVHLDQLDNFATIATNMFDNKSGHRWKDSIDRMLLFGFTASTTPPTSKISW